MDPRRVGVSGGQCPEGRSIDRKPVCHRGARCRQDGASCPTRRVPPADRRIAIPRRILAISFKKDAATNLAARVRQRCLPEHAARFDSLTFDAFSKGLIDRFGQVLPASWRPDPDYKLIFPLSGDYREFLQRDVGAPPDSIGRYRDIQALSADAFVRHRLFANRLEETPAQPANIIEWLVSEYWAKQYSGKKTALSFPMIGRLVELLLRSTPVARNALQLTYSHVFLDEFQDTTQVQYDLLETIFWGSTTVLTAVGDNKQQIMRWAMAMEDPFKTFEKRFAALRVPLFNNYRSSPELVRIQTRLAKAIDADAPLQSPRRKAPSARIAV
ncbi:UvrD-helicase domain-containing protein (plasmid) [Aliirhizobium terrae]|uniref:UvrD-helicase domain-containing protein n=1 Tax=Terrirhizobium terrae TaxID=2926709 RepID=UPI002578F70F|nr:UvrD-helicase domain-containing protein [Rhizobium sp. CC-CFT758]WJH38364.1 UvrD-helicase domain-containing protein [Rhizobium sp. CC-CFT758]